MVVSELYDGRQSYYNRQGSNRSKYRDVPFIRKVRNKFRRVTYVDRVEQYVVRLSREAVNASGDLLYGPRFASQLSRALGLKSPRMVRYWSAGTRQCSEKYSLLIVELVHVRRGQRLACEVAVFANYVIKLPPPLRAVALSLTATTFEKRATEDTV
jgi:hypothetical protein